MFSGLVEALSPVLGLKVKNKLLQITVKRPSSFCDLKIGESVSVNGLCLTLEQFNKTKMLFSLGPESLKITGWKAKHLKAKSLNLERSLTLQSLVGGHIVTGHVDDLALVTAVKKQGESRILTVKIPSEFKNFFWKKAYITLNGVSLTINQVKKCHLELCIIPQTLKATNLSLVKKGDSLNFEVDYMTRPLVLGKAKKT